MVKKQTQKFSLNLTLLTMILSIALYAILILMPGVQAVDVPADAEVGDPDCFWSNGPGSELYVPSGKTCTIDFDITATNVAGWTDYAVIVYSGGTLEVVGNGSDTKLDIDGDIYIMGTVNIGDTNSSSVINFRTINGGDLTLGNNATASMTVRDNSGAGTNRVAVTGTTYVGDSSQPNTPTLTINSTYPLTSFEKIDIYGHMNVNGGTTTASGIELMDLDSNSAELNIATGAIVTIDSFFSPPPGHPFNGYDISLGLGMWAHAGTTTVTVNGTLNAPTSGGDVSVIVGSNIGASHAKLVVGSTGTANFQETNTFAIPDTLTGPTNALWILSDMPYGLEVQGAVNSYMFIRNNGYIHITGGSGWVGGNNSYQQASALKVGDGDTLNITGMADIDGDSVIDGTLNVTRCTKITNDATSTFSVGSTGTFNTNTAGTGCTLANTSSNDGLNVQGTDTVLNIANGSGGAGDQTVFINYGDFRVDDGGTVDANGYYTVEDDMIVEGGSNVSMQDTDIGDNFKADNVLVNPDSGGASSALSIEASSAFDLVVGQVDIGTTASAGTGGITVHGTLNVPTSSTYNFKVSDTGQLVIEAGGKVNDDASSGQFLIEGGVVVVRGASGNPGLLYIADQELQMSNGSTTASLIIGDASNEYGVLNSEATPAAAPGFDFQDGVLDIQYHSEATFNDTVELLTGDEMYIGGYLRGTDGVKISCDSATVIECEVEDSGEIKVEGSGTPTINVLDDLNLVGKLNGNDGAGDVSITNNSTISSRSINGEDSYFYIIANNLTIGTGSSIDVSEFARCISPGGTPTYGGSFGGEGMGGNTETFGEAKYTTPPNYATSSPNPIGMCGYNSFGENAGFGGGAVYIDAYNIIDISGPILANGEDFPGNDAGSGSGGLIVINHNITHSDTSADFKGAANIEADGGNGSGTSNSYGGGGGRIVINSILFEQPDDDETGPPHYAYEGGIYANGGGTSGYTGDYAAAGTIVFLGDDNNPNGTLIVDQGNRPLGTSAKETNITATGDYVFDRIESKQGAKLTFDTAPGTDPVSCFVDDGTSSVDLNGGTCTANADKPDTLYINNTYTGAQSGDEPWFTVPVTVSDGTPEFSFKFRNPENGAQEGQYALIEVDDSSDFSSPLWSASDSNNPVPIATVGESARTEDIGYGGAALTGGTTYYVRAAFSNSDGSVRGLWTHRDMGNYYQFDLSPSYMEISNDCSDVIAVDNVGNPLQYKPNGMYGSGSCTFTLTSTDTAWDLYYSKISDASILNDGTGTYVWADIDNAGADCTVDNTGNTEDEEYGFNLTSLTGFGSAIVETDAECSSLYTSSDVFDIETLTNKNKIIEGNGTTISGATLDLVIHANVDRYTAAETYELDTIMILSDTP